MSADLSKANRASAFLSEDVIEARPGSTRLLVSGSRDDLQVGMRQIHLSGSESDEELMENPEITVYDTLGRYTDPSIPIDVLAGLPPMRNAWIEERGDTQRLDHLSPQHAGGCTDQPIGLRERHVNVSRTRRAYRGGTVTQLHYARKGLITPEMEYVAIRENCGIDHATTLMRNPSVITPELVRNEIACGRAVIPNNVNHPETEPMIIGQNFGVKVAACIPPGKDDTTMGVEIAQMILALRAGADTVINFSHYPGVVENREWVLRNSSVPIGTVPLINALAKVDGDADALTWKIYRNTLIEHAEQGVDYVNLFIGNPFPNETRRPENSYQNEVCDSQIMSSWKINRALYRFLPAHFDEICDIMRAYDVTLMLDHELPVQAPDKDITQVDTLELRVKLVNIAWCSDVQVIANGFGNSNINRSALSKPAEVKIKECSEAPQFGFFRCAGTKVIDAEKFSHVLNTAQNKLLGNALLCCTTSPQTTGRAQDADDQALMICSQLAHVMNVANGHIAARQREHAMLAAKAAQREEDYFNLCINPEFARMLYG